MNTKNILISILAVVILILIFICITTDKYFPITAQKPLISGDVINLTNDSAGGHNCFVDEKTKYVSCGQHNLNAVKNGISQFRLFKIQPKEYNSITQLTKDQLARNNQIWNGDKVTLVSISGGDCHVDNPAQSHWRGSSAGIMQCKRKGRNAGNVLTIKSYNYPDAKKMIQKGEKVTFSKPDPTYNGIINYCRQDTYAQGKDYMKCIGTRMTDNTVYKVMSARMSPDIQSRGRTIEIA